MLLQKYQYIILGLIFPLKVEINKEQTQNYFFHITESHYITISLKLLLLFPLKLETSQNNTQN